MDKIVTIAKCLIEQENSRKVNKGLNYLDTLDVYNDAGIELLQDCIEYLLLDVICNAGEMENVKEILKYVRAAYEATDKTQAIFSDIPDNTFNPFIPKVTLKYHANSHLHLSTYVSEEVEGCGSQARNKMLYYNPYQSEIRGWEPNISQMSLIPISPPAPLHLTNCVLISSIEGLQKMISIAREEHRFAFQVEIHSSRSYQGYITVLTISCKHTDWIIDCIYLRDHIYLLNVISTDPKIEKRDFGLYFVNLFDTCVGAKTLDYPCSSLHYLLKSFVNPSPIANNQYLLFDWRCRPLSNGAIIYACTRTHYLIHVSDCLRNELLNRFRGQLVGMVRCFHLTKEYCLNQYSKKTYNDKSFLEFIAFQDLKVAPIELAIIECLHKWRDSVARQEDESVRYVLPNNILIKLAMVKPNTINALCGLLNKFALKILNKRLTIILSLIMNIIGCGVPITYSISAIDSTVKQNVINSTSVLSTKEVFETAGWVGKTLGSSGKSTSSHTNSAKESDLEDSSEYSLDNEFLLYSGMTNSPSSTSLDDGIPLSMKEIYNISNRNRRRNKEKKRVKDEGDEDEDEGEDGEGDVESQRVVSTLEKDMVVSHYIIKRATAHSTSQKDAIKDGLDMMCTLGWINEEEAAQKLLIHNQNIEYELATSGGKAKNSSNKNNNSARKQQNKIGGEKKMTYNNNKIGGEKKMTYKSK